MKRMFIVLGLILGVGIAAQVLASAWFYATESEDDELSIRWHRVWTMNALEQETRRLVEETDSVEALMAALEASNFDVHYTESIAPTHDVDVARTRQLPDRRLVQGIISADEVRALQPGPPVRFKAFSYTYYSIDADLSYREPNVHDLFSVINCF